MREKSRDRDRVGEGVREEMMLSERLEQVRSRWNNFLSISILGNHLSKEATG